MKRVSELIQDIDYLSDGMFQTNTSTSYELFMFQIVNTI